MSSDPSPTGRTVRMPRDERRRQLLSAAHKVFVDSGYHGASMDEIAELAQVSKPVLYQHFPGKRDLYLAILDSHVESLLSKLLDAVQSTDNNKARVRATIGAYFEFVASDSQAHRLLFESDVARDPDVAERLENFNQTFAEAVSRVVHDQTSLPESSSILLGHALIGMSQVAARAWLDQEGSVDLETAIDLVSRLAWRGIGRVDQEAPAE
ncbi:AcrR family transcriptional regulator [Neomicrococcus aestuarii]|uniref:AcrR family transcriptional regulator n=1 Tax=Neomicrococcus aestuarii TaxID=556325 RepID=A0A7W8TVQ2_9MICC|nr:TetR/AcrR family transcriptional regulator [Neomicrococcus aestuarii]MBB5513683.1 AcrR family transcriptional regulator [Neomicrococcus aestuarii]